MKEQSIVIIIVAYFVFATFQICHFFQSCRCRFHRFANVVHVCPMYISLQIRHWAEYIPKLRHVRCCCNLISVPLEVVIMLVCLPYSTEIQNYHIARIYHNHSISQCCCSFYFDPLRYSCSWLTSFRGLVVVEMLPSLVALRFSVFVWFLVYVQKRLPKVFSVLLVQWLICLFFDFLSIHSRIP